MFIFFTFLYKYILSSFVQTMNYIWKNKGKKKKQRFVFPVDDFRFYVVMFKCPKLSTVLGLFLVQDSSEAASHYDNKTISIHWPN